MSDDLIMRSDAIKTLCDINNESDMPEDWHRGISVSISAMYRVPSADRPQGEWVWDKDGIDWNIGAWICSECHARNANLPNSEKIVPLRWSGSKYCPNCGARMKGADNESVHSQKANQ